MKKPIILFLALIVLLGINHSLHAQDESGSSTYNTAVGLRLGYPASVSLKHFFTESNAGEVYVGFRGWSGYSWFSISGAYLHHEPIKDVEGLQWYVGGGASVYFWSFDNSFLAGRSYSNTTIGIQGYLGLDYKFESIPLNLSLDWIPTYFFNGFGSGFGGGYGSLAARYTFN